MNGRLVLPFFRLWVFFRKLMRMKSTIKSNAEDSAPLHSSERVFLQAFLNYTTIVRTYMKNHYAALLFCFNIHYLSESWKMYNFAVAKHQR